jgi:hypothetical protein
MRKRNQDIVNFRISIFQLIMRLIKPPSQQVFKEGGHIFFQIHYITRACCCKLAIFKFNQNIRSLFCEVLLKSNNIASFSRYDLHKRFSFVNELV